MRILLNAIVFEFQLEEHTQQRVVYRITQLLHKQHGWTFKRPTVRIRGSQAAQGQLLAAANRVRVRVRPRLVRLSDYTHGAEIARRVHQPCWQPTALQQVSHRGWQGDPLQILFDLRLQQDGQ